MTYMCENNDRYEKERLSAASFACQLHPPQLLTYISMFNVNHRKHIPLRVRPAFLGWLQSRFHSFETTTKLAFRKEHFFP